MSLPALHFAMVDSRVELFCLSCPIPPATIDDPAMTYPYNMLIAACLFITIVSSTILLALSIAH